MNNLITEYHPEWQTNRMRFMVDTYTPDFFRGKKILELGSCNGYIGAYMQEFGATVLSVEGREENVEQIKKQFPNLPCICMDLDTSEWTLGTWDIIINFGLYYHLQYNHEAHLKNCIRHCDTMFFESVIHDKYEPMIFFRHEIGVDQSMTGVGGAPTTSYVENIFKEMNVFYDKITDSRLNGNLHRYDWIDTNSGIENGYARRFWIVNTK